MFVHFAQSTEIQISEACHRFSQRNIKPAVTNNIWVDVNPDDLPSMRFVDGTGIVLRGDTVLYVQGSDVLREVSLPPSEGWKHLGWQIEDEQTVLPSGTQNARWVLS